MRIFQSITLVSDSLLSLDERASHHLARVLRAKVGDKLILFNGQGGEYEAEIYRISKKTVEVKIQSFHPREAESNLTIYLAQGIARGEKMDWIIQKAVELGVNKIIPLTTDRCNVRLTPEREAKRQAHWDGVVISACEQSGRNQVPAVSPVLSLQACLSTIKADRSFILSPRTSNKLIEKFDSQVSSLLLLIGPEGGFSAEEMDLASQHGVLPLNLGPRILRTETAGMAAIAILQGLYGDMGFQ